MPKCNYQLEDLCPGRPQQWLCSLSSQYHHSAACHFKTSPHYKYWLKELCSDLNITILTQRPQLWKTSTVTVQCLSMVSSLICLPFQELYQVENSVLAWVLIYWHEELSPKEPQQQACSFSTQGHHWVTCHFRTSYWLQFYQIEQLCTCPSVTLPTQRALSQETPTVQFLLLCQYHITEWKLSIISPLKPPPPKVPIIQNCLFKDHHILQRWQFSKISPFKTTTPPKSQTVKKSDFQSSHTLSKWKLLKISPFRTITPSKSKYCWNQSFQDYHLLSK